LTAQINDLKQKTDAALKEQRATLEAEMLKRARQIEDQAADHIKTVTDDMIGAQAAVSHSKQELASLQARYRNLHL
jgi:2',3'-cyclic-nucleotide 2'-phosphodiesterase (5'-nucleotidase family)